MTTEFEHRDREVNDGRKLPAYLENPVDNLCLWITRPLRPVFWRAGFTANHITVMSGIFWAVSVIRMQTSSWKRAAVNYAIGYMLDVMDGNYARYYNMTSVYGDILDHSKDIIIISAMNALLLVNGNIPPTEKAAYFSGTGFLSITSLLYFACQERFYGKPEEGIVFRALDNLHTKNPAATLRWLRWFGPGTHAAFVTGFLWFTSYGR